MLKRLDGRARSEVIPEEELALLEHDLKGLNADERDALIRLCEEHMEADGQETVAEFAALDESLYDRHCVDIDTFLKDEYYLGHIGKTLYPCWQEDLREMFAGDYHEAIISGSIGCGKNCVVEGTMVPTSSGVLPIESVVAKGGGLVLTDQSRWRQISAVHDVGTHDTVRIETKWGYVLEGRPNHRVRVLTDGQIDWKRLDAFSGGEVVLLSAKPLDHWGERPIPLVEAELMGAWCGDGWFGNSENSIQFSTGHEEDEYREHLLSLISLVGHEGREVWGETAIRVDVHSQHEVNKWKAWGCVSGSENKVIPWIILESTRDAVCAFLRGYFDTDGSVYKSVIDCSSVSWTLIDQVQQLLLGLGIASSRFLKPTDCQDSWVLQVRGDESKRRFAESVGFNHPRKAERLRDLVSELDSKGRKNDSDVVYGVRDGVKAIWAGLPSPKSQHRNLFGCVYTDQKVSRPVLRQVVGLANGLDVDVPASLSRVLDDDLLALPVRAVSSGRAHCYDLSVEGDESYVANGFLSHNTFASVALCYQIYQMSCLRDPQAVFGLEKGSEIAFCCISVNEKLSRRAVFGGIKTKIMSSRYFMDQFPYRPTLSELRFPHNIWVAASSSSMSSALSLNTFGGILDEVNFFQATPPRVSKIRYGAKKRERHSHAETLYQMILRRMKSRYANAGKLPGVLMMISSKSHTDAFTERRIAASATDPNILVREYALWEAKPRHLFSAETFTVFVGNERIQSRIISREDERVRLQSCIDHDGDYEGSRIVEVPIDFKRDFEEDLDSALQDLAGVATVSISPFVQRRETLYDAIDETRGHPMKVLEWNPQHPPKVDWSQLTRTYSSTDHQGNVSQFEGPIVNPDAPRHLHLDTSLNHDATGLAIGHVAGTIQVERRDEDGLVFVEDAPEIYVDFILRIVPPPGDDIILADIRTLIYSFMDHGFAFNLATTDQYQSAEMRQYLELQRGVETKLQSMDRNMEPYMELRAAFYEGRVNMYAYEPFLREMQRVVHDKVRSKIDHLEGESKDIADALAGIAFTLRKEQALMPIPLKMGISTWDDVSKPDEWLRKDYAEEKGVDPPEKRGPGSHHWLMPLSG